MQSGNTTHLLQLLFVGLLAGFEIGVHYGIGSPPQSLREDAQIVLRQSLVRRLRILAPALYLPSLLLTILATVRDRHNPGVWLSYAALAMFLVWALIRIVRAVPVNRATLEWSPEQPPINWRALVERTEQFHVVAAWAAVIAFACLLFSTFYCRS
jgi:hypothetical protein